MTIQHNLKAFWYPIFLFAGLIQYSCSNEALLSEDIYVEQIKHEKIDQLIDSKFAEHPNEFYVLKGTYANENYFLVNYCCPTCQDKNELYNESGTLLCTYSKDIDQTTTFCSFHPDDFEQTSIYWISGELNCLEE